MTRVGLVALALLLALGSMGCSLSRSVLGTPPDTAMADGGGIDAPATPDAGDDAADMDAWRDDANVDASMELDAFVENDAALPDTNAPIDTGCAMGTTTCVASEVWGCDPDGALRWRSTCTLGCSLTPRAHCIELRATHVNDETLLPSGTTGLEVASGQTVQIDATTGAITTSTGSVLRPAGASTSAGAIGFSTQTQASGPDLGIFSLATLHVAAGGTLVGVGSRALVLLVAGDVTIEGVVDVGARGTVGGPGGYSGGGHRADGSGPTPGRQGDVRSSDLMSGGGGGGHGGTGASGGNEDPFCCASSSIGGAGGAASADADGVILLGGSGGGGGSDGTTGGVGGGGGGVLQISSRTTIHVTSSAIVRAVGAGGGHGHEAGGGGGAGGTVFLEARTIVLDGVVTVNAGGGGGGGTDGADGGRGTDTLTGAGGGSGASGGANGGRGAGGAAANGSGGDEGDGGGGGGGGGGRVSFVTQTGMRMPTGTVTPTASSREAVATIR